MFASVNQYVDIRMIYIIIVPYIDEPVLDLINCEKYHLSVRRDAFDHGSTYRYLDTLRH
jgi:hypothetical protein